MCDYSNSFLIFRCTNTLYWYHCKHYCKHCGVHHCFSKHVSFSVNIYSWTCYERREKERGEEGEGEERGGRRRELERYTEERSIVVNYLHMIFSEPLLLVQTMLKLLIFFKTVVSSVLMKHTYFIAYHVVLFQLYFILILIFILLKVLLSLLLLLLV
jgi:hypothetical protein